MNIEDNIKNISLFRTELMGIAAIWIMCLHIFSELDSSVRIPLVSSVFERGNLGVDIFLILSGMGLYFSLSKNSNLLAFYKKRFIKVVIPWITLSFIYWLIYMELNHSFKINVFIKNWLGFSFFTDGTITTWYIQLIIILYILYPLFFKLQNENVTMISCIIVVCVFLNIIICLKWTEIYNVYALAIARIPAFLIGSMIGQIIHADTLCKDKKKCTYFVVGYSIFMCLVFCSCLVVKGKNQSAGVMFYYLGATGVVMVIILLICVIFKYREFRKFRILKYIGNISLEIYLISVFIRNLTIEMGYRTVNSVAIKIIIMIGICVASIFISQVVHIFFEREFKKIGIN